jgi:DNA-binding NarL/FixJ family response regulator
MPYKIYIVEDHPAVRKVYAQVINREPDLEVIGEAATAIMALEQIPAMHPDLVLVDVSLPGMSGLELLSQLHTQVPELSALIISGHNEVLYAKQALQVGARGYLDKLGLVEIMIQAIRRVLSGEIYVSAEMRQALEREQKARRGSHAGK